MRGGKRQGSGRKPGTKLPKTLEREKELEAFRNRVALNAQRLFDKQMTLASGQQFLYRIDTETVNGKKIRKKPVIVEDPQEIADYLDGEFGDGESLNDDTSYYYITTKEPSNLAIDSMLNRTFGKPQETIEHKGNVTVRFDE